MLTMVSEPAASASIKSLGAAALLEVGCSHSSRNLFVAGCQTSTVKIVQASNVLPLQVFGFWKQFLHGKLDMPQTVVRRCIMIPPSNGRRFLSSDLVEPQNG
eukprot:TRINITY_DN2592_c0_g1_i3.p2 TRINITY_DN2592_c0_g1~~TRINITY_DN2592_c0_g1_i3.p2  ORF type:complete len:102 (+),score=19.04 TRINITY_DN2592_c0_g1_i3:215-520(+)